MFTRSVEVGEVEVEGFGDRALRTPESLRMRKSKNGKCLIRDSNLKRLLVCHIEGVGEFYSMTW